MGARWGTGVALTAALAVGAMVWVVQGITDDHPLGPPVVIEEPPGNVGDVSSAVPSAAPSPAPVVTRTQSVTVSRPPVIAPPPEVPVVDDDDDDDGGDDD
ncbi:hypothetical protein [Allonocardiopsis opalescens]|uniref:Uncharacterized protein n=1 Tax=Allonocardiopsis opalescens TaxID=1144618 RepID=A0A2T0PXA9_9ACTN|nr:hypothetical protein [Allonocardiopsis opalescens]PRX96159.1 hypothetical protein CLV72_108165 [Allonocardiopsis opalescens]